jgi:hypothetical protein
MILVECPDQLCGRLHAVPRDSLREVEASIEEYSRDAEIIDATVDQNEVDLVGQWISVRHRFNLARSDVR